MTNKKVTNIFQTQIKTIVDEAAENIRVMKSALSFIDEQAALYAKIQKAMYDAYIKEGFTPDQAIALCKFAK